MTDDDPTTGALPADRVNLRAWFVFFLLWMGGLAATALWGLAEVEQHDSTLGWSVWLFGGYAFYMSLCCTFFPAPTTWIVMLVAGDLIARQLGLAELPILRVALAATVGAFSTGVANLNEYHIFVFLLRWRRMAKVRETRFYDWASARFAAHPFLILVLFAFIPIPVDVIRWLAITVRYSRARYVAAYVIGRWLRYAVLAVTSLGLNLTEWQIIGIQCVLVVLAAVKILSRMIWKRRSRPADKRDSVSALTGNDQPSEAPPKGSLPEPDPCSARSGTVAENRTAGVAGPV